MSILKLFILDISIENFGDVKFVYIPQNTGVQKIVDFDILFTSHRIMLESKASKTDICMTVGQ